MKATKLRIGNWVYDANCEMEIQIGSGSHIDNLHPKSKPIPLTEEWLERFGFNQFDESDFFIPLDSDKSLILMNVRGYWYPRIQQEAEMSHQYIQEVNLNYVKQVHQLQNLYFALTGEELTLTK